ncbi:hypothetical protein GCM10010329_62750 [Streptomyces spiroverticillatus]|nr:hypothetical protein GCM10010329_62750 [Streptomyces spiroverticillatus]
MDLALGLQTAVDGAVGTGCVPVRGVWAGVRAAGTAGLLCRLLNAPTGGVPDMGVAVEGAGDGGVPIREHLQLVRRAETLSGAIPEAF